MSTTLAQTVLPPVDRTFADVLDHLGGILPERVYAFPPAGAAEPRDVEAVRARSGRTCELIDGVLVEKTVGYLESRLAIVLGYLLETFLEEHDLGIVLGEAGTLEILPNQVRAADISFLSWDHFPDRQLPQEAVPALAPDLAVEILSDGNTEKEMERKLRDYFEAGVQLVWYIDPRSRTARSYTALDSCKKIPENGPLSGGTVLPGFELSLDELFARAERRER